MTGPSDGRVPARGAVLALALIGAFAAEYVLWPAGDPAFDLAGGWSILGAGLVACLGIAIGLGVARPLYPRVRGLLASRSRAAAFGAIWAATVVGWMMMSAELVFPPLGLAPSDSGIAFLPSLGPFGVLPAMEFSSVPAAVSGYLSPMLALYGLLGWLWTAALALLLWGGPAGCSAPTDRLHQSGTPLAASWLPTLGLGMYCCAPPVLLSAVLLVAAPGTAAISEYARFSDALNGLLILGAAGLLLLGTVLVARRTIGRVDRPPDLRQESR